MRFSLFFLMLCTVAVAEFTGVARPEGTSVLSTGAADGLVLLSSGTGGAVWGSVEGTGDVIGPDGTIAKQIPVFDGTTGKAINAPDGSDANNYAKIDFNNLGEQFYLHGDVDGALSYIVHNTHSSPSSRSIISFGNDTGVNVFSIQANSTGFATFPNRAVWASHFLNGSAFTHSSAHAPFKFSQNNHVVMEIEGDNGVDGMDGRVRFDGVSTTEHVYIDANQSKFFQADKNTNNTSFAEIKNSNTGSNAYSEIDIRGDNGQFFFGQSSTGVNGTWIEGNQAYIIANNHNGLMIGTQGETSDIKIVVGGASEDNETARFKANGNINMVLPTYANDAAAGSGGLVTGDLYQQTTTHIVFIKQ